MSEEVDKRYYCLCNTHVKKGTIIVAILSIVISIINTATTWIVFKGSAVVPEVVAVVICGLVIAGCRMEKSWLFLPYLLITACAIFGSFFVGGYLLVLGIIAPDWAQKQDDYNWPKEVFQCVYIALASIMLISTPFYAYFWYVTFRAYKFIRDEIEAPRFGVKTIVYQYPNNLYPSQTCSQENGDPNSQPNV